jgi:hypothetical protein
MTAKDKAGNPIATETSPAQTEDDATRKPVDKARFKGPAATPPKAAPQFLGRNDKKGPKAGPKPQGLRKSHGRGR